MKRECKSILVVEDDDGIRDVMRFALETEGYSVFTAANGKEGLEMLPRMSKPCLILLDLMMPVMDGWEFSEALEKDMVMATIPIVVVSAFGDRKQPIGSKGLIKKPVDLEMLLQIAGRWCGASCA